MAAASKVVTEPSGPVGHIVRLMEAPNIEYPDLYMDIYVEGDKMERSAFAKMFAPSKCKGVTSPLDADLVVFTGGVDVDPNLYGAVQHTATFSSSQRDKRDKDVWDICVENGIPMLGVCRGAQFGAVMKGAKLYQDVDNHNQDHNIYDVRTKTTIHVSSVHHQMVIEDKAGGMVILADSNVARTRWKDPFNKVVGVKFDVEAFWYPDVAFLGVQGHPEYSGYDEFRLWTLKLIEDLIWSNPDVQLVKQGQGGVRRLTKEHRDIAKLANINRIAKELN